MMKFGVHMSTRGGLTATLDRAVDMGCRTMQIFTTNPMGWKGSVIDPAEAESFLSRLEESDFGPVFTHTPYLLNFAGRNEELRSKSIAALAGEMVRASAIGAAGIVTHLGSSPEPPEQRAVVIAAAVDQAFDQAPAAGTPLLLENSAGAGNTAGAGFEELAAIIAASRNRDRLAVCLDTCHMWGAGYALKPYEAAMETFDLFDRQVGMARLNLIHANDSKMELGSHKDRHEHIGEGFIGDEGFINLFRLSLLPDDLPFIIETPGDDPRKDCDNLRNLSRLYHAAGRK